MTAPLATLQTSVHAALMPETTSLYAKASWGELRRLLRQYFRLAAVAGAACVLGAALLVGPVIRLFTTPDYLPAAGPTVLLAATVALALFTSPAYPIGVISGRLRRYNVTQVVGVAILALYLLLFQPTAMGLAVAVLFGVMAVIIGFALPVYRSVFSRTES
jgi:O-antigen/teichoic acid export membrane protein